MADQNELWPLSHNWQDDWGELHEFKTEIIVSRDEEEQRRALRAFPRVTYRFKSSLLDDRGQAALARLAARQAQTWLVPHARLSTTITNAIPNGTVAFTWDTDEAWGIVGKDVVFVRPDGTSEWGEIATYSAGVGTLVDTALVTIPAGSRVHHGIRGRFDKTSQMNFFTTSIADTKGDFLADPGNTFRIDAGSDLETYHTRPVWTLAPNWATKPRIDFLEPHETIDFGYGRRDFFNPVDYVRRTIRATYLVRDQATQDALYGFFIRRLGQQRSFYMPSWVKEFLPTAVTTADLTVAGTETDVLFSTDPSHKHVVIFKTDGTKVYAEVDSIATVSGESVLTFLNAIPAMTLSDIRYVTWLLPCRLASDRLEFKWVTREAAPVTIPVRTLRDNIFWGAT